MPAEQVVFGIEPVHVRDLRESLQEGLASSIDFIIVSLFHSRFQRYDKGATSHRTGPGTRSDRILDSQDWVRRVVGKVSDWISLDSPNDALRQRSEDALMQEVSWAMHLGLQAILLPSPPLHASNYCRSLLQFISASSYQQFWIKIPLLQPLRSNNTDVGLGHVTDGWIAWNNFRLATGHIHNIGVALELSPDLDEEDISTCKKWAAEPVKAIIIPTSMFISNKLGFPVLSRHHQVILSHFLKYKINFVFSGPSKHVPSESNLQPTGYSTYREYILFLRDRVYQSEAPLDPLIAAYRDRLQSPLQPLMDNLESQTYETFERDQIKYDQYERAILEAIRTLQERHEHTVLSTNDSSTDMNQRIEGNVMVVTVVGAGRGPLVAATLSAAKQLNQLVRIYAVEKNDNAVITLRNRVITDEWVNVTVVHSDMRHWQPPELAQIMVSELLGSWGDNELSPECLDGAQKCLDPFIGISIPYNYKSYLSPISTSRLWTGVRDMTPQKNVLNFLDTPFIVKFHNFFQIAPSQELFLFTHPNYPKPPLTIDNRRYKSLSFECGEATLLHGFCGCFLSILFGGVTLSTVPEYPTPHMNSWFPLFLPLGTPVTVAKGDVVTVHVWRCVGPQKIWYEWCLSSPVVSSIQNSQGQSYWIGL